MISLEEYKALLHWHDWKKESEDPARKELEILAGSSLWHKKLYEEYKKRGNV